MDAAFAPLGAGWTGLPRVLLRLRRLLLVTAAAPVIVAIGVLTGVFVSPPWAALSAVPLAAAVWAWWALDRNWRSWSYSERVDDLLVTRGVLVRKLTVVPYGRMQLVEVVSGPLERRFGIASVELHTASASSDARIPGLLPGEAARLRDRLTELGQARSAGL